MHLWKYISHSALFVAKSKPIIQVTVHLLSKMQREHKKKAIITGLRLMLSGISVVVVMVQVINKLIKYSPFPISSSLVLQHCFVFLYKSHHILLCNIVVYLSLALSYEFLGQRIWLIHFHVLFSHSCECLVINDSIHSTSIDLMSTICQTLCLFWGYSEEYNR